MYLGFFEEKTKVILASLTAKFKPSRSLKYDKHCCEIMISPHVRGRHAAVYSEHLLYEWNQ